MNALRAIPAGLLAGASAVLAGAAKLAELGARRLAPPTAPPAPTSPVDYVDSAETPGDVARATAEETGQAVADAADAAGDALGGAGAEAADTLHSVVGRAGDGVERAGDRAGDALAEAGESLGSALEEAEADTAADSAAEAAGGDLAVDADALSDAGPAAPAGAPPARDETGVAADLPPADDTVLDDNGAARTYESHIAEIADHNVATVVREIQDLSTEELGQLFEYESAHRKRKTVLQAIERAASPADEERIYTTETPS
jgi:hypothetical protein